MSLPRLVDYQHALQNPATAFLDPELKRGSVHRNPLDQPVVASGGFALTFKVDVGARRYAVRCFHKTADRLDERYRAIAEFIGNRGRALDFLVDVKYVGEGVLVQGHRLPVLKMAWVEGSRLDFWVSDHLRDPSALDWVRRQLKDASSRLRELGVAHGDLQHGNIMVTRGGDVRLVDYDGAYLPGLASLGSAEMGHRNFQHPDRHAAYDDRLDVFSSYVLDLSLEAIKHDPALWDDFNTGENLVFDAEDFREPGSSEIFARLAAMPALAGRARLLAAACGVAYEDVEDCLAGGRRAGNRLVSRPHRGDPLAMSTTDRKALLERVGDEVTVVGRVTTVKQLTVKSGHMTLINFGNYKQGDFTIVGFSQVSRELRQKYGTDLAGLRGKWVSTTGLLTQYDGGKDKKYPVSPRIEVKRGFSLRLIDRVRAEALLAPTTPAVAPPPARQPVAPQSSAPPPTPAAQPPTSPQVTGSGVARVDDLEARASKLFGTPGFARPAEPSRPVAPTRPAARVQPSPPVQPPAQPVPHPPVQPVPAPPSVHPTPPPRRLPPPVPVPGQGGHPGYQTWLPPPPPPPGQWSHAGYPAGPPPPGRFRRFLARIGIYL
ncbi:DNA-binding protein [Saccharothrix deserti]|uniref:DNA-binding protein n=1 Tax=Saccharothrix deserti TaxID=2593674 RepID=UPI00131EC484|nr:DNA-binding protein [Saccharothrix deserti]